MPDPRTHKCPYCGRPSAHRVMGFVPDPGYDPLLLQLVCHICRRIHYAVGEETGEGLAEPFQMLPTTVRQAAERET